MTLATTEACARCSHLLTLRPDRVPNRFLSARDWSDPRYESARDACAALYRDELDGEPHPFGARHPSTIITHWSREWEYPWTLINGRFRPGMSVVDLGCGGSPVLPLLDRLGCECIGVDLNFRSTTGRNNLRGFIREPEELFPRIRWLKESMDQLSIADASVDRVLCVSVLEHVHPDVARRTFGEMARVLRPDGLALITTDVDGSHRTLSSTYEELIAMASVVGLRVEGPTRFVPDGMPTPGTYDVVGFVLAPS